jgi:putative membrane protein
MDRRSRIIGISIVAATVFISSVGLAAERDSGISRDKQFLAKAAGGQKAEMALGELATKRGASEKVKDFGHRMIEDHRKASQEVTQLASKEHIDLPADMPVMHKEKAEHFAQLSGEEFDRAYMTYMVQDHMKDVKDFEQSAKELKNPRIQQWASGALPVLKEHLNLAKTIAENLGIDGKEFRK